ncbi:UvrD-helicase domain-containing protein [Candidatus Leptofilum sp.]|uniref:UvrD-helicase domain-containing protein n=1 Tax=Candidatus Leptofilum sp. TaxID=3241576 RepID=UPI003B5BCE29
MTDVLVELTPAQEAAIAAEQTSFLLGSAGTGKTFALQQRLLRLLQAGEPAYTLLVIVAEPDQAQGYLDAVHQSGLGSYADLKISTYNQMAMEMVKLFWPLVARSAGFERPYHPPTFLSYDLAQLLMWHIITPMLNEGAFADLRLRPQQIVSQLLDTLNRAALNSLSLGDAIERQVRTWAGEPERIRHLNEAADAARQFRATCLRDSLLDLSLAIEVFDTQVVQHPEFHKYFSERFRHLIVDNIEEQTPAGQNFVVELMDETVTTAVAYDAAGGYKRFLAADPLGANTFRSLSAYAFDFKESFITSTPLTHLANLVENQLMFTNKPFAEAQTAVLGTVGGRYRREMVIQLAEALVEMMAEHDLHSSEIAIIAPYLDGALRYMLGNALRDAGLPYYLLRRRSSPRDEPRVRAWLTWLALAHPDWGLPPSRYDMAEALTLSIHGLDPARAELLAEWLYQPETAHLLPISELPERIESRIGMDFVGLYEEIRLWLAGQDGSDSIDLFLHSLFTLLSERRFQPEPDVAGAAVCDWLVQAATRLRQSAEAIGLATPAAVGYAFIDGINQGLVTANPPELGDPPDPNGIMISTIYGYLLAGSPVRVQVWLETAATGWWDIPNQPLSNAFVLAQSYDPGQPWTMDNDFQIRNQLLSRIVRGLTARCSDGILLATSDLDRRGVRQDGPLWRALQAVR